MRSLLIITLSLQLSSCSSYTPSNGLIRREIRDTYQVGIKCPEHYYYSYSDKLCYYLPNDVAEPIRPQPLPKHANKAVKAHTQTVKAKKQSDKKGCARIFEAMNRCMK